MMHDHHPLKELDASHNAITEISDELGALAELKKLELRENNLCVFNPNLGSCSKLEVLNLEKNHLPSPIPPELCQLKNLKTLLLSDNPIRVLTLEMKGLVALTRCSVVGALETSDDTTTDVITYLETQCQAKGGWFKYLKV